jgi:uncharacterized SAM-binding protein YcdF (DUF218 family)
MSVALDAAVILGCRVEPGGAPSSTLERRAHTALSLLRAGEVRRVVASGGRAWGEHVEADSIARWLVERGVDAEQILLERLSLTTVENAIFVAELAQRHGLGRLGVVTCDWHLPRALASFTAVGLSCVALPALTPEVPALTRVRRAFREWLSGTMDAKVIARAARHGRLHPLRRAFEGTPGSEAR